MLKRLILVLALLACSALAPAWQSTNLPHIQGWCEVGAQVVETSGLTSTTQTQGSFPACTVTVYNTGTLALATITGGVGSGSNPFTATVQGHWDFYGVIGGAYDIKLSGGTPAFPTPYTLTNIAGINPTGCPGCVYAPLNSGISDNSANLNAAIALIHGTGTSGANRGVLAIGADGTGGTNFNFTQGVDLLDVPGGCVGINNASQGNITLNFNFTSGIALEDAAHFHNCTVTGVYAPGMTKTSSISTLNLNAITNTMTATTAVANSVIAGTGFIYAGDTTTACNGVYRAATVISSTQFTFQVGTAAISCTGNGTIYYYPTVGVDATNPSSSTRDTCCGLDWQDLNVLNFGVDFDISANQIGAGSTNDWRLGGLTRLVGLIGVQSLGNAFAIGSNNSNVANGTVEGTMETTAAVGFNCGPYFNGGTADSEESGCGNNELAHINYSFNSGSFPLTSADSPIMVGVRTASYGNNLHDNYLTSSAPAGVTDQGMIDTSGEDGPNPVKDNRLSSTNFGSTSCSLFNDNNGQGKSSCAGYTVQSGFGFGSIGTSPNLLFAQVIGPTGGTSHSYGMVAIDYTGNQAPPSAQFICPGNTFVTPGNPCPANLGPLSPSSTNYERICYTHNPNLYKLRVLQDATDTALSGLNPVLAGENGNNCFAVGTQSTSAYTPVSLDQTGGLAESNPTAVNTFGLIGTVAQCTSSASPAVCGNAPAGYFTITMPALSVVVDTTAVTTNSTITLAFDDTLGSALGVTCNTAKATPSISARTAGTSFTVSIPGGGYWTASANPFCFSYQIIN